VIVVVDGFGRIELLQAEDLKALSGKPRNCGRRGRLEESGTRVRARLGGP
jgi:hypothetical protein